MADPSREALAPLEAQFNAHPAIQAFLKSGNHSALGWMRAVSQAARDTGINMPHDYQPTVQGGQVVFEKKSFIDRNGWFLPAVAVGAPLAAGVALGAFGGAAAAGAGAGGGASATGAGAATGVGLGETGAVTGLAGSGFGGAATTAGAGGGILSAYDKYSQLAGDAGNMLGGASAGLADGRRADNAADLYAASQNNRALVDAAQFNRDLPMTRAQQTARGDLMASPMQDAAVSGSGRNVNISGGVRPSSFSGATTQAGEELRRQALAKLMTPEADKLTPQIVTPREPGAAEDVTGAVGTGLSILGAYNNYRRGR